MTGVSTLFSRVSAFFTYNCLGGFLAAILLVSHTQAADAPAEPGKNSAVGGSAPHLVVEGVTEELMAVIKASEKLAKEEPQKYFDKVQGVLEPSVSFRFISRKVMTNGVWKAATKEQRKQFIDTFTRTMVETFAKGMANYTDVDIRVLPPEQPIGDSRKAEVLQEVKSADGTVKLAYTMAKSKAGQWKLINVVLNGVNLGENFQSQFKHAYSKHKGNIDLVIQSWGQEA